MRQIRNFGFMPPVQEPDVHHPAQPCGGAGKQRGQPACAQHAVRPAYYPAAHRQGFGSHLPVGNHYFQLADRTVPALQVPASQGVGASGDQLL